MDATKPPGRLKVVLLSLPPRTQAVLDFFIANTGRSSFTAAREDQADAAVFDHDHPDSRAHWLQFHQRYGKPGIMLSMQPHLLEHTTPVAKPITPAALLAAAANVTAGRLQTSAPAAFQLPPAPPPPRPAAPGTIPVMPPMAHTEMAPVAAAMAAAAQAASASPALQPGPVAEPIQAAAAEPATAALAASLAPRTTEPVTAATATPAAASADTSSLPSTAVATPSPSAAVALASTDAGTAPTRSTLPDIIPTTMASTPAAAAPALPRGSQPGFISPPSGAPAARRPPVAAPANSLGGKVGGFLRKLFVGEVATTSATRPSAADSTIGTGVSTVVAAAGTTSGSKTAVQGTPEASLPAAAPKAAPAATRTDAQPAARASTTPAQPEAAAEPAVPRSASPLGGQAQAAQPFVDEALLCGNREDLPTTRWNSDASLRYELADHVVGALREAWLVGGKWRVPTHIELPLGRVVVDTAQGRLYCEFDPAKFAGMWATPLAKRPKTRTLNRQEAREFEAVLAQPGKLLRLDQLLWRGGMLTGAGRLPAGVDVTRTIYLKHWPNFTRIERTPHSVRMAALWATRGASIIETAKLVGVPQRQVIAFYNGMAALDLVTEDGSHIRRAQRKHHNRGLLTRLLGWLNH
ncbi:MAG: hypothetical protein RLZZ584_17 [Pseudomonadota bacterium]